MTPGTSGTDEDSSIDVATDHPVRAIFIKADGPEAIRLTAAELEAFAATCLHRSYRRADRNARRPTRAACVSDVGPLALVDASTIST